MDIVFVSEQTPPMGTAAEIINVTNVTPTRFQVINVLTQVRQFCKILNHDKLT